VVCGLLAAFCKDDDLGENAPQRLRHGLMMSPIAAIVGTVIFVTAVWTIVAMVLRYLSRKFEADTLRQKAADERYKAAKKNG